MTNLPRHLLPESLLRISEYCGDAVMWTLWGHYAGCHVVVPREIHPDHPLAALLGDDAASFAHSFGGEILTIPKGDAAKRAVRDALIRQDRHNGDTLTTLARRYNLTERQVCTIVHTQAVGRVNRTVDLFDSDLEAVPMHDDDGKC